MFALHMVHGMRPDAFQENVSFLIKYILTSLYPKSQRSRVIHSPQIYLQLVFMHVIIKKKNPASCYTCITGL